jgi:hypothetical protein
MGVWSLGFSCPLGILSIPTSDKMSTISGEIKKKSILMPLSFCQAPA